MKDKKAIFINTASQIVVRLATLVLALISVKLLTNYLGTSGTGNFNTITTYINFFIVIADLGLFSVAVREISKSPKDENKIIANVFSVRLITALISAIIAVVIVYFTGYSNEVKMGTLIASGFLFFNLLSSVYDIVLQVRLKMQFSALSELLSKLISLVALYIIIRSHLNFYWVISTVSISGVAIFFFKYLFAKKYLNFKPKYNDKIAGWILSLSWPIGIVFILNNLFFKIDTLLLFAIKGASVVGIYTVAYKVLEVTIFAGSYFSSALKPSLSKQIINDKQKVANIINKSILVMLLMSLPISILSIVYAKEIIVFLSNSDFISGSKALVILSLTLPFVYIDVLLGELLIANDERKLLIKVAVFILLFNLGLNLILIPKYSYIGAAAVTLISEIVLMLINIYNTKKIINYSLDMRTFGKILSVTLITYFVGVLSNTYLKINFIFMIIFLLFLYFALAYLFNIFSKETIKNVLGE